VNPSIEELKAEHARLAERIAALESKQTKRIIFPAFRIDLSEGEKYAGWVVGKGSEAGYPLILIPGETEDINWEDAKKWAAKQGGKLPTRREQSLLFANLKEEFQSAWYWSGEQYLDERYAWYQHFSSCGQGTSFTDHYLRARAVRRVYLEDGE
jgi:hypothetical protein